MAHKTKDGKKSYTNKSMADQYNRKQGSQDSMAKGGPAQSNDPGPVSGAEQPGGQAMNDGSNDQQQNPDGAQMAQEHGPAQSLMIQHDDASNMHTVHAAHPDGHEHQSTHGTKEEAHKYAADCAGSGMMS